MVQFKQHQGKWGPCRTTRYFVQSKIFHHLFTVLVFKLFIFTVVKTEKFCFEQNKAWYAMVPICLDAVSTTRLFVKLILMKIIKLLQPDVIFQS